jgi:hypothetical protein
MLQKFTNKSSYDKRYYVLPTEIIRLYIPDAAILEHRFVWINLKTRTIHMSQHMTKERRHKEASLNDVTSVSQSVVLRYGTNNIMLSAHRSFTALR